MNHTIDLIWSDLIYVHAYIFCTYSILTRITSFESAAAAQSSFSLDLGQVWILPECYLPVIHLVYKFMCLFAYLHLSAPVCLSVCLPVCLSVCMSVCLSVCLPVCLYVCLSIYLSVCLSVYLSWCPLYFPVSYIFWFKVKRFMRYKNREMADVLIIMRMWIYDNQVAKMLKCHTPRTLCLIGALAIPADVTAP